MYFFYFSPLLGGKFCNRRKNEYDYCAEYTQYTLCINSNIKVRRGDCPEDKKKKLTKELHDLVKGNIKVISMKSAATLYVQCTL